jgi:ABC-2 type transport system permease protein
MMRALHAEWTKLRTVPSNVVAIVALTAFLVAGTVLLITTTDVPHCQGTRGGCPTQDSTALTLAGVHFAQLAAIVLAVALVSAEFHPRVVRITFAMNPRRTTVFTAKAAVIAATVLATAATGAVGAVLAGRAMLRGKGLTAALGYGQLALADRSLQRAVLGTVLYLALVALLSVGLAAAIRHSGAAIGTTVALLYGPYLVTLIVSMPVHTLHVIQDASPMTAGLAVQATVAGTATAPLSPWTGLAVLAAYAAGALLLGGTLFKVRDA